MNAKLRSVGMSASGKECCNCCKRARKHSQLGLHVRKVLAIDSASSGVAERRSHNEKISGANIDTIAQSSQRYYDDAEENDP
jgi:hypothetical protein